MLASQTTYKVTWEKLPDDFVLDNEPVDNINQPLLAAALTESLELAGRLPSNALTMTNYGICATVNGQIVVKAPDWGYVPSIRVSREQIQRSYTPQLQGDIPTFVMEFLSDTDGKEYSIKPTYPPGKWFYYEQVLQVPNYAIFEPDEGVLEVYQLDSSQRYQLQTPDLNNRYWIAEINLFLGTWLGTRENRTGHWLRWWNEDGEILLWGSELAAKERERADKERERAEQLAKQLRALGVEPDV
ncbi:Uma2 family endonuclease [Aetokthonos hydrillicola Thurmond2011]|jgi:Uma2 family endonuclease|uniref:Uma2 family endonuclease n=1 Tax=Aetokthonos hydrillicola Thurmond2011 TaxID=2712845 RepID=A0AAP5I9Y8_9CYAN|nr:Uma2 family endonuclease [Aetokthonos hydrillicola]MBO3461131.1 Uma2 family endonuclease [Aetokthonos hydrillicola CCALA 1050]MBW4586900.1 Uma2 family endonuclease [Aetokthonos hydrillicola CCALA 1050]MDR9897625.1 Uma2 family endonuclease [Aetokthonos hydrillicola Thurmond2011]